MGGRLFYSEPQNKKTSTRLGYTTTTTTPRAVKPLELLPHVAIGEGDVAADLRLHDDVRGATLGREVHACAFEK